MTATVRIHFSATRHVHRILTPGLGAAVFALVLLVARTSVAQPGYAEARAAFDRGVAAMDTRRFDEAVEAFETSYRLRPAPVVLYNLGMARQSGGHLRAAIEAFEHYLSDPGSPIPADEATALRAEIARLRQALAHLDLNTEPTDAAVTIDGQPVARSRDPVALDPGPHVLIFSATGHRDERRELTVGRGEQRRLAVQLERVRDVARVVVEPSVVGAVVLIDDAAAGTGRTEWTGAAGEHRLTVRAAGYETYRRTISVAAPGVLRLDVTLTPHAHSQTPGWVIPTVIAGGAVVIAAVVITVLLTTSSTDPPIAGTWGLATGR